MRFPRAWLPALAAVLVTGACGDSPPESRATGHLSNGKELGVSAEGFSRNVGYSNMAAWADVPAGTRGELDVTGPVSYRCPGTFQTPPASWRAEYPYLQPSARDPNWPSLHFRDSLGGSTFTLRVFSPSGSVSTTLPRGSASPVPTTTEFHPGPPPPGCDQTGGPPPAPPESAVAVFPKLRSEVSAI